MGLAIANIQQQSQSMHIPGTYMVCPLGRINSSSSTPLTTAHGRIIYRFGTSYAGSTKHNKRGHTKQSRRQMRLMQIGRFVNVTRTLYRSMDDDEDTTSGSHR
jgi:hypothetical protein